MAELVARGLRRSVGVPGLFATAYGNVGSSIYHALGLVALHALGLTPLVFMLAGGLFALTATTYAEGASLYPEAGGSSITIAISAFFVPHYPGAFLPSLTHGPGDVIGGIVVVALLAAVNVRGLKESARLNLVLAVVDLGTQVLLVVTGFVLVLDPGLLVSQVHLGVAPSWSQVIFARPARRGAHRWTRLDGPRAGGLRRLPQARRPGDHDVGEDRARGSVGLAALAVYPWGVYCRPMMHTPVVYQASTRRFVRHYLEMVAAMFIGMGVLYVPAGWALSAAGSSWSQLHTDAPALMLLVMAVTMTVPMVGWMAYRGHGTRANAEMSASMLLPTFAVIGLLWADVVADLGTLMAIEHVAMLASMLAAMLLRRAEYAGHHHAVSA